MKKIIYSLVIMIAAGSLFTSCIEQVEPLGIQDMRFAKAEYIRALKDLRAADAELVRAEAAHELARARYVDAMTANLNADTEYQQLLNEYQQLINEARQDTNDVISQETANRIDSIKKRMELREKQHAAAMVAAEDSLASAEERLRVALRNIALSAQTLTPDEKAAVEDAVANLYTAFNKLVAKEKAFLEAKKEYTDLTENKNNKYLTWDSETHKYVKKTDLYQKQIDKANAKIVELREKLANTPDSLNFEDVNAWKAELDQLIQDSIAVAYSLNELQQEIAYYYVNYVHDGVKEYNDAITAWKMANYDQDTVAAYPNDETKWKEPAKAGSKPSAPREVPEGYKDSVTFKALDFKKASAAFLKFEYLLKSYEMPTPAGKNHWKAGDIITLSTDSTKLTLKAHGTMKNFVMGEAGKLDSLTFNTTADAKLKKNGKDTVIKALYGLNGAVDVLERDKVLGAYKAADTAAYRKAMEAAGNQWKTDRDTLINGLVKYQPYVDALSDVQAALSDEGDAAAAMATAVQTLKTAFSSVNTTTLSKNDSVRIIDAFVAFATAREAYLDYKYDKTQAHDSLYFVFPKSWDASENPVLDSVKFTDLNYEDLAKGLYNPTKDFIPLDPTHGKSKMFPDTATVAHAQSGLANIANQLLNPTIAATILDNPSSSTAWADVIIPNINENSFNAFYKLYKYVDGNPAKMMMADGITPYESKALKEAKAAVLKAINDYVAVYNRFWNPATAAAIANADTAAYTAYFNASADEKASKLKTAENGVEGYIVYKADKYSYDTFNTPTNVVTFVVDGKNVDWSNAIGAILGSVDAAATKDDGTNLKAGDVVSTASIVFGDAEARPTEFYNYMKAVWDYNQSLNDAGSDISKIKAWVADVAAAFAQAETDAAKKHWDKTEAEYNAEVKAWEAKKEIREAYMKAKAEFVGTRPVKEGEAEDWTDADGNKVKFYPITKITSTYATIASIFDPTKTDKEQIFNFELVEKDVLFGGFTGLWVENVQAGQQALAESCFPEFPEMMYDWYETYAGVGGILDELAEAKILINALKDAYYAAAKIAQHTAGGVDWDNLLSKYQAANETYRENIKNAINAQTTIIDTNTKLIADLAADETNVYDLALAKKAVDVAKAEKELEAAQKAYAVAQENLKRIIEYLKGLDVDFVTGTVNFPTGF